MWILYLSHDATPLDITSTLPTPTPTPLKGQCGYPPCRHTLGEDRLRGLRPGQKKIDAKNRRIVDVTRETAMVRTVVVRTCLRVRK